MNGWPTQAEIDAALAQGIMLNVGRCEPYPGESAKARIARGMSIAAFGTVPIKSLDEHIAERDAAYIRRVMAGYDPRSVAERMAMSWPRRK